jgi:hypothetical protein
MARLIRIASVPAKTLAEHEGATFGFFVVLIGATFFI